MGDMGLGNAYGGQAAVDALRAIIKDRLTREQQQFENSRLLAGDDRENRRLDQNDKFRQDTLDETAYQHRQGEASKSLEDTFKAADVIPAGSQMPFTNPMAGRLSMIGQTKDVGITPADPPSSIAAPTNAAPSMMPDTIANAPGPSKRIVGKLASAKQLDTQADNERQLKATNEQAARDGETVRHNKAMENKPISEQGWTIQQGMVNGKPGWVRINSRTGAVKPVEPGEITPKPSAQEAQHTQTNKETIDTLAQLDQAIENAKDLIGPGAGRISSLEQMAGSADQRIQALGVKMKAAKMRVDHAVTGSVRAAASPQMMQQWDNILANKVTPEGLKAGVQAMREIIGGGAPSAGGGTVEKWGRDAAGNLVKQ